MIKINNNKTLVKMGRRDLIPDELLVDAAVLFRDENPMVSP